MRTPTTHREWLALIAMLQEDKHANTILNEICSDFENYSTIHRTKCKICNGNIIKFDEFLHHRYNFADISKQTFEFHNKNCSRKQKLLKLNEL